MNARFVNLIKAVLSIVLLVAVVRTAGIGRTYQTIATLDWRYFLVALLLYLLGILVRAGRWSALLAAQHIQVPWKILTQLYFVGAFFNNFLPTGIGGDVVKMYELSSRSQDAPTAISTVLVDRVLGLLVLFAFALVTLPWGWRALSPTVIALILALSVGSVIGISLLLNRKLVSWLSHRISIIRLILSKPKIQAFYSSFHNYRGQALCNALLLSLLFNLMLIAVTGFIGQSLDARIGLRYYFLFVPIISALSALPISLGGLGIREEGYVYLFTQVGVSSAVALSMSLGFYAVTLLTSLVGGVIYAVEGLRGYWAGRETAEH